MANERRAYARPNASNSGFSISNSSLPAAAVS
jgi:hypothetical protein